MFFYNVWYKDVCSNDHPKSMKGGKVMDLKEILRIDGIYKLELTSEIMMQLRAEKLSVDPNDILEAIKLKLDYYIERVLNGDIQAFMPELQFDGYQIEVHFNKKVPDAVDEYLRKKADQVRDKDIRISLSVSLK